jgi:hypothetical protein
MVDSTGYQISTNVISMSHKIIQLPSTGAVRVMFRFLVLVGICSQESENFSKNEYIFLNVSAQLCTNNH